MIRHHTLLPLLSALPLAACAMTDDGAPPTTDRDPAVEALQRQTGAPVALQVSEAGYARVLAMTPGFPVPGHATDPALAATNFLAAHHAAFQLDAADAGQFVVTRVDTDRAGDIRHVTLNRVFEGVPVFQGAITVHMDPGNGVFRALGDDSYHIAAPINRVVLGTSDAAVAAGRALGLGISPVLVESGDRHAVFTSAATLDPIHVDLRVVHVAEGNDRFSYQTTVSWLD